MPESAATLGKSAQTTEKAGAGAGNMYGDNIDRTTFEQILEMDDDEEDSGTRFSKDIVWNFFDQAEATIKNMEQSLKDGDLEQLSQLGHFLKGSSATLGLTKVKDSCEKIQDFGSHRDATGSEQEVNDAVYLERIRQTLSRLKEDYREVEELLREFYGEPKSQ